MSLLGIAGTLAAVGAGYADAKSAKERRARQDKYDAVTDRLLASQEARMSKPKSADSDIVYVKDGVTDPSVSDLPSSNMYAHGGMIGASNPCDFVDHTWMRASFKK